MTREVIIQCTKDISESLRYQGSGSDIHIVCNLRHTAEMLIQTLEIGCVETEEAEVVYRRLHDSAISFGVRSLQRSVKKKLLK